jgi:hypothetical protein
VTVVEHAVRLPARHPGQVQVVQESARFNVLECGRRFGKTALGKDLATESALDGRPVGWFAPSNKYLSEAWRNLKEILREVITHRDEREHRLELLGGGVIECWTMIDPDAGRSRKYGRVIIDEAGKARTLRASWEEAIRATLSDLKGDAWFLGTPKGGGYFHNLYVRGQGERPRWKSWRFGTIDNPFIDPKEIEDARLDLPEEVFNQEYRGIPAADAGNPFGLQAIAQCFNIPESELVPLPHGFATRGTPVYWGVDVAKYTDWTVLIALDAGGRMCRFVRFQKPWRETIAVARQLVGSAYGLMDSTGVGDPILEELQSGDVEPLERPREEPALGSTAAARTQAYYAQQQAEAAARQQAIGTLTTSCPNLRGIVYTATSKQHLMERLTVALQHREVSLFGAVLRGELDAFEYQYSPATRRVKYSAPDEMHDDCVNALALAIECRQSGARNAQGSAMLLPL